MSCFLNVLSGFLKKFLLRYILKVLRISFGKSCEISLWTSPRRFILCCSHILYSIQDLSWTNPNFFPKFSSAVSFEISDWYFSWELFTQFSSLSILVASSISCNEPSKIFLWDFLGITPSVLSGISTCYYSRIVICQCPFWDFSKVTSGVLAESFSRNTSSDNLRNYLGEISRVQVKYCEKTWKKHWE